MDRVAQDLERDLESLSFAQPQENTPPRLLKAGLAARSEVLKHIGTLARKIAPPEKTDIESATQYHWTAVKGLGTAVSKFGRAQRYMAAVFPAESEKINGDFNRLSRLLVELEELTAGKRREREEIWFCRDLAAKLRQETAQISDLSAETAKAEERLAQLREAEARLDAGQQKLERSEAGRRSRELEQLLDQKNDEMRQIEAQMTDLVAPLSKALDRIVKQGACDRLSLQYRQRLEQLSRTPLEALDQDVAEPLQELRQNLAVLGLKDRKKEKTLQHLDHLIQDRTLQKLKSRHCEVNSQAGLLKVQLEEAGKGLRQCKDDLASHRREIRRLEPELLQSRDSLAALESSLSQHQAELQERMEKIAGHPVKLEIQADASRE